MSGGLLQLGRASCGAAAALVPLGARARALAWSALFLAVACAPDAGRAVVTFRFSEPPTLAVDGEPVDTVLTLRVEERAEVTRFLGASAPRLLPAGSREEDIVLPGIQIPHGDHRVVVMELALIGGEILYYGESAPFSLHAGDVITVPIALEPRARPALQVEVLGAVEGRVPSSDIEVRVTAPGARRVELSNLSSFEGATAQDVSPDGILAWDLDRGLRGACVEDDACPRKLSVRVRDDHDVPSTIVEVALVVDTRGPAIQPQTLSVLLPSGEPWLSTPTALAAGATATITFAVTERLGAPPVLLGEPLERTPCVVEGLVVRCAARAPDAPSPGIVPLRVRLVDLVGHEAVLPLTDLELAPAAPPPPDSTRVVLERAPWGRGASAEPYYVVRGEAGAATPGSRVVAFPGAATTNVVELARTSTVVDPVGRFTLVLPALADNQAHVGLVLVSAAGQPSDGAPTQPGVQATLTTRGRVSVRVADPRAPVSVERVPGAPSTLFHTASEPLSADEQGLLAPGDGRSIVLDARGWWRRYERVREMPAARYRAGFVHDRGRGEWVLFGGLIGTTATSELWVYDGRRWVERSPEGAESWPPPRSEPAVVYDPIQAGVLVFGGRTNALAPTDDTWLWTGEAWLRGPSMPAPRHGQAFAYDRARGETLAFGGYADGGLLANGDTWRYRSDGWHVTTPTASGPSPRARASMTYDPVSERVLMFGGESDVTTFAELWSWDGTRWRLLSGTTTAAPPRRVGAFMAYSPALGGVVLGGGRPSSTSGFGLPALADAWLWRDGEWRMIVADGRTQRSDAVLTEADEAGENLLYGGRRLFDGAPRADMARLVGTGWVSEDVGPDWPHPRRAAALAYDPGLEELLLVGGTGLANEDLSDMWAWDGRRWSRRADLGRIVEPMLAYDEARSTMVLFATTPDRARLDVFEARAGMWLAYPSNAPAYFQAAVGYTAALGGVAVFGVTAPASSVSETLLWRGPTHGWESLPVQGMLLSGRREHGLVAVPSSGELWMQGGYLASGMMADSEVYTLGGTGWSRLDISAPPPPAAGPNALVLDPRTAEVVVLSGGSSDVWAVNVDGAPRWRQIHMQGDVPVDRQRAAVGVLGGRVWLFGGGRFTPSDELWSLEQDSAAACLVVAADLSGLGLHSGARMVTVESMQTGAIEAWDVRRGTWAPGSELDGAVALDARQQMAVRVVSTAARESMVDALNVYVEY